MNKINPDIEASWKDLLKDEFNQDYFFALKEFLLDEKKKHQIYPSGKLIFNAFNTSSFDKVKIVIIGQDPYHGPNQAHGLCFSVSDGVPHPPSLKNIFKELQKEYPDFIIPQNGNLSSWAKQGVLLINAVLTVRAHQAESHRNKGWEKFTDSIISIISDKKEHVVFFLWGNYAKAKAKLIDSNKHLVLFAAHPSPLSAFRGFFGCQHFIKANEYLEKHSKKPINWQL